MKIVFSAIERNPFIAQFNRNVTVAYGSKKKNSNFCSNQEQIRDITARLNQKAKPSKSLKALYFFRIIQKTFTAAPDKILPDICNPQVTEGCEITDIFTLNIQRNILSINNQFCRQGFGFHCISCLAFSK